jgi:hypothetical protein
MLASPNAIAVAMNMLAINSPHTSWFSDSIAQGSLGVEHFAYAFHTNAAKQKIADLI